MAKIHSKRQVVLDTETTGLDCTEHRIIEVGCVELENRRFTGNFFHRYINPERAIDKGALAVHGISSEFLSDKPLFGEIAEELLAYLDGAELIIHNAPFDLGFLDKEFNLLKTGFGSIIDRCNVIDTLPIARQLHPSQRNNLDALCKRYKVDNSQRELHGALKDARLLGEVYLRITGGQVHFDISAAYSKPSEDMPNQFLTASHSDKLIVLKASEEEQAMHEAYMEWLGG